MDQQAMFGLTCEATLKRMTGSELVLRPPRFGFQIECYDKHDQFKWFASAHNLVTDEGITDLLNKYFMGATYTAAWYLGLVTGPAPVFATADKAASHAGWTEFTNYGEAARPTLIPPPATTTSVNNSASKANYTCDNVTSKTVSGLFVTTASGKGAVTGILYSEAVFTQGDKLVTQGDVLAVTATLSGVTQ